MAWETLQLPKVPSPVTSAVDALKTIANTASTALTVVKGLIEAISAVIPVDLSAPQLAINAAVAVIEAAVKSLTEDTGVYVLLVPPRSLVLIPEAVKTAFSSTLFSQPTIEGLNVQAMFSGVAVTTHEAQILRGIFSATGGNAGFVRTVIESFDDLGDASRPILATTDAVAGFYVVAGASNIADLIPFTNGMSSLIAPGQPLALDPPAIPVPQGLKTKIVAGRDVLLQWALQVTPVEVPVLGVFALITEVAIIRSTSVKMLSVGTTQELFGTTALTVGMTDGYGTKVIAVQADKGTYLDDEEHPPAATYYYAASFHIKLGTLTELVSGGGKDLGFTRVSNVSKTYLPTEGHGTPRSVSGTPPDWIRTPRTIDLFPKIGGLLNQVSAITSQLGATTSGYSDLLKSAVKVIEQQIKNYETLATNLTSALSSISAIASINLGSVSARPFSGTGGVPFVKKDIVKAFGDTADPKRPAFDGNEFVSGVIILATTPDAIALLEQLLGSLGSSGSLILDALAKIDVALSALETAAFKDNMTPGAAAASSAAALLPQIGETDSYCYHSYAPSVTFDDSLSPK